MPLSEEVSRTWRIVAMLTIIYEPQFSKRSFGFCPIRGCLNALREVQKIVNEGYKYVVDLDLERFFDTVSHSKLIEILSRTIKDGRVVSLIHKYLRSGVIDNFITSVNYMSCNAETYTSLGGSNGCADQLTNWDGTKKLGLESVTKKKGRSY